MNKKKFVWASRDIVFEVQKRYSWLAKNHTYSGAMVALFLPEATAKKLALPGGLDPSELHVTLVYLGEANQITDPTSVIRRVEQFASSHPPLKLKVGGVGQFNQENGEGKRPFYASVDSPDLPTFRQALVESLNLKPDTEHGSGVYPYRAYRLIWSDESC